MQIQLPEKMKELCSRVDTSTRAEILHGWNLIFKKRLLHSARGQVNCPMSRQMECKEKCQGCQWIIELKDEEGQTSVMCQPPII